MNSTQLFDFLKNVGEYIEYSFYKNSSEIMGAIMSRGLENVFEILSLKEINKGIFECKTAWKTDSDQIINKNVNIDISSEMVFITEVV